jgi:hypothetical protein
VSSPIPRSNAQIGSQTVKLAKERERQIEEEEGGYDTDVVEEDSEGGHDADVVKKEGSDGMEEPTEI